MIPQQHGQGQSQTRPWYEKKASSQLRVISNEQELKTPADAIFDSFVTVKKFFTIFFPSLLSFIFACAFGTALCILFLKQNTFPEFLLLLIGAFVSFVLGFLFIIKQVGQVCSFYNTKETFDGEFISGLKYIRGKAEKNELKKGIPAPEMALNQFLQQVRAYAVEKSYSNAKNPRHDQILAVQGIDTGSIIKRRWNDVLDSLNEFEIYLANDPKGMIEKLILKSPLQNLNVSQIFRDVAETFDSTWRRKGINIEHAIVTPLKATTNEGLLRRLLVGPWRTCVHLVRRGSGVIFSAKSAEGKIITHWECDGLILPQGLLEIIYDTSLSVNERVERAFVLMSDQNNNQNILFALISFVTWYDLVCAAGNQFSIKQGNEGFVIELTI